MFFWVISIKISCNPPTLLILMSLWLCVVVKSTKENFRKGDIKRETPWNKQQNYILSAYYLNRKINLRNNKRQKTENMFWKCFQNLWNALLRADMEALYAEHKIKVALYSSFWVKLHPCPLLFLKKEFTLSVFSVCCFTESLDFGTSTSNSVVEKQP